MRSPLRHIPALDGLRGVAVVGVLAFHLGHLRGGYLGVDLFFVLSGFLITSLLLAEWHDTGRVSLRSFWARRARRLLPALFLLIGALVGYAALAPDDISPGVRDDAFATLGYVANWHSIVADHGYWDLFAAPSLLAHTWSLAIEEQLYVLWPLLVVGVLRIAGGRFRALLGVSLLLAAGSWTLMALLHAPGDDTARVYFGTDTRAGAVLAGAALAALVAARGSIGGRVLRGAGIVAATGLAIAWVSVSGTTSRLYEGGFALCGIAATIVIASVLDGRGPLARVFSAAPLRHIGTISYGVYLWHWPVFVVLTPARTGMHGWPLLVAKLVVTFAVSELSYRVIELPIRRGTVGGWRLRLAAPAAIGAVIVGVVTGTAAPAPASVAVPEPSAPPSTVAADTTATRVLVVGDSGAAFLGEGLVAVGADREVEVRNAGTIACGLITDGGRLRLDGGGHVEDPAWCADRPARWRAELDAFDPDVALLVIGWPGLGDREIDGAWRHPCDAHYDRRYAEVVRAAIAELGATGARVVVADSPYLALPVVQSDHALRVDCLNDVYHREAARAGAGVGVLRLGEWLCESARRCTIEQGGVTLRPDGIHFRDEGAVIAGAWVLDQLLR